MSARPFLFFLFTVWGLLTGCGATSSSKHADPILVAEKNRTSNDSAIRAAIPQLKTGDVVLRRGRGPDSYLLAHLNLKDPTYSHCGIVVVEHGYPFVYHSIGGEDNPDARLRRDSAAIFLTAVYNYGFAVIRYPLSDTTTGQLTDAVQQIFKLRPLFDLDFDLATDNKLYCSEFVYKAFRSACQDTSLISVSFGHGRRFIGIDDLYSNGRASFISKVDFK